MDEIDWAAKATAWELAALSFRYPGPELEGAVASGEWAEAAREIVGALGLALPEGFGAGASAEGLRPEATRLFVGAPEPACSPYEGVWRAADDGVQALLFVNPHSMEVERFMRGCGLGRPEGTNEPLDHVATECELMEHLALRAAGAEPPEGAPAGADLPGGSPEAAYGAFLEGHARTW
uniref:molecular chaperone TorD family protein n=1 Tax=Gordonibacter urolithinfaciens TaxID=1335613 RepID=UPI003AB010B4